MHRLIIPCCVVAFSACNGDNHGGPPTLGDRTVVTAEDTPASFTIPVTSSAVGAVVLTVVTGPSHGTLTGSGPSWTYTPALDYSGGDRVVVNGHDSHGSATATVSITITAVDDAPVGNPDSLSTGFDAPLTVAQSTLLANDTDVDSTPLTLIAVAVGTNGTPGISGSNVVFTPDSGFKGTATFVYTVSDGVTTADVTVTVTVAPDAAPVAVDDIAIVAEDAAATAVAVLDNDTDVDAGPKAISAVTQPPRGTVAITGGGTGLTYAPEASFCNALAGLIPASEIFTYTLTPGGSTATVVVTVACVDDPPVAVDDVATVAEDSIQNTIAVLVNETDIDGGLNVVTSVTAPANGAVAIGPSGLSVLYTPNANYCNEAPNQATDAFTYAITGGSAATVTVRVTCACGEIKPTDFVVGSN